MFRRSFFGALILPFPFCSSLLSKDKKEGVVFHGTEKYIHVDSQLIRHETETSVTYFENGLKHRLDGPAFESEKREEWWVEGQLHRVDGGPAIWDRDGYQAWYVNNKLHRGNGPAVTYAGSQSWYWNGELHRIGGPAIISNDGEKQWWENGIMIDVQAPPPPRVDMV